MVAVNSLLYILLSAGLSANPPEQQGQGWQKTELLDGMDLSKLCPAREHFDECNAHCQRNCTNFDKEVVVCPKMCVAGCVCDEGLVRGDNGKCVLPKQCPVRDSCPRGEHYVQCTAHCQWNCTNFGKPIACPRICVHGCACDEGTVRGPKGKCIKPDSCPPRKEDAEERNEVFCPHNEVHSECMANCQRDCTNAFDENFRCDKSCSPGCVCERGLVRDPAGHCILPRQCPHKVSPVPNDQENGVGIVENAVADFCPKNESYSKCDAHCEKTCTNQSPVCPKGCVPGCKCKEGFVRAPTGWCIEKQDCRDKMKPGPHVCPKYESYQPCGGLCQRNCTTVGRRPTPCDCYPGGCLCNPGLTRGPDGNCIHQQDCPAEATVSISGQEDQTQQTSSEILETSSDESTSFCPVNEEYSPCSAHCEGSCREERPICNRLCVSGCKCKGGFVRGPKGTCIPKRECKGRVGPGKRVCPANEEFNVCIAHCQWNCTTIGTVRPCPRICVAGCICKEGLIRGTDGQCIPESECPDKQSSLDEDSSEEFIIRRSSGEVSTRTREQQTPGLGQFPSLICRRNETYSLCPCTPTCEEKDEPKKCILCLPGCDCKKGYVYGPEGNCIKADDCPRDKRPDECTDLEFYDSCGPGCPDDCSSYNDPVERPCTKKDCRVGCYCIPGMVRGPDGDCIFPFECSATNPMRRW